MMQALVLKASMSHSVMKLGSQRKEGLKFHVVRDQLSDKCDKISDLVVGTNEFLSSNSSRELL